MAESWMAWTILALIIVMGAVKFVQKAVDEWDSRDYDEYHFTGYENPCWRK